MRKLRIFEHISLDGVIQLGGDTDGDFQYGDWTAPYRSSAGAQAVAEAQGKRFDLLLGRRTSDIFSGYWPKQSGPIADGLNAATKYVATHRPESLGWGPARGLGGDIGAGVHAAKATDGPDLLVWGSSTLTPVLFDQGLVDELVLLVYPVLLGRGKKLFPERLDAREFALVDTQALATGVLMNTYRHGGLMPAVEIRPPRSS
jgi:dihydrofolate reductase